MPPSVVPGGNGEAKYRMHLMLPRKLTTDVKQSAAKEAYAASHLVNIDFSERYGRVAVGVATYALAMVVGYFLVQISPSQYPLWTRLALTPLVSIGIGAFDSGAAGV